VKYNKNVCSRYAVHFQENGKAIVFIMKITIKIIKEEAPTN
jgi:hypothetical protein